MMTVYRGDSKSHRPTVHLYPKCHYAQRIVRLQAWDAESFISGFTGMKAVVVNYDANVNEHH